MISLVTETNQVFILRGGLRGVGVNEHRFCKELYNDLKFNTGLMPPGLKWVSGSRSYWLFQYPPRYQTIIFHNAQAHRVNQRTRKENFELILPWTAMLVELDATLFPDRVWIFALEGPLQSFSDIIGVMPLPNLYPNAQVCFPENARALGSPQDIGEAINLAYEIAWSSYSNIDIAHTLAQAFQARMPYELFVNHHRRRSITMMELLDYWEALSLHEVLPMKFLSPFNSILEPEAIFNGHNTMTTVQDIVSSVEYMESQSRYTEQALEFSITSAHSRALNG